MQKVDMGIAIVCMINNTALKEHLNIVNLTISPFTTFLFEANCVKRKLTNDWIGADVVLEGEYCVVGAIVVGKDS